MTVFKHKIYLLIFICLSVSCTEDNDLQTSQNYQFEVPANFPNLDISFEETLTEDGVALGEKLFFDSRLSSTNTVSCATCHNPKLAFTDGESLSNKGVSGKFLLRHAPTLANLAWATNGLFWDGGSINLESQAFAPLAHEDEMFQNLEELMEELNEDVDYVLMFQKAFDSEIKVNLLANALAQFQRTLISANSKYDYYIRKEKSVQFSTMEQQGHELFKNNCAKCHSSDLFTDNNYHNNGLESDFTDLSHDEMFLGRYRVTRYLEDLGKYRTPTLRNIEKTAPYMHDGRFSSLEDVLDFHDAGITDNGNVDESLLRIDNTYGISLSAYEKESIIAFLKTLTDNQFLNDERFSEH